VVDAWSHIQVYARNRECDVGWAANYVYGARERCTPDPVSCRPEAEISNATDMSAYRCCIDFSVQFYPWSIAIMAPEQPRKGFFEALLDSTFQPFCYNFVSFLFIIMVVFGHLIWLVERKENPEMFPTAYIEGIDDGLWWAMVTATTVGYGDRVPITPAGRVIALVYMVLGIALFAILSGHLAGDFLSNRQAVVAKTALADLKDLRVCGYPGVLNAQVFAGIAFTQVPGGTMAECGAFLRVGEVDAVVYDTPVMLYWRSTDAWARQNNLVVGAPLMYQPIGLAFPEAHPGDRREEINSHLIDFINSDAYLPLLGRWFPEVNVASKGGEQVQWGMAGVAIGLLLLYVALQAALLADGSVSGSVKRRVGPSSQGASGAS